MANTAREPFHALPEESVNAVISSLIKTVRESTSLEITVEPSITRDRASTFNFLTVTVPPGAAEEQWMEIEYRLHELGLDYEYTSPSPWGQGRMG